MHAGVHCAAKHASCCRVSHRIVKGSFRRPQQEILGTWAACGDVGERWWLPKTGPHLPAVKWQISFPTYVGATYAPNASGGQATGVIKTLARPPLWKIE